MVHRAPRCNDSSVHPAFYKTVEQVANAISNFGSANPEQADTAVNLIDDYRGPYRELGSMVPSAVCAERFALTDRLVSCSCEAAGEAGISRDEILALVASKTPVGWAKEAVSTEAHRRQPKLIRRKVRD